MKKTKRWAAGLVLLALLVSHVSPAWTMEESSTQTPSIESKTIMDVNYGYDNTAKDGRYIPVEVTLHNMEEETFNGQLQVLTMESDYNIYRYDYPVYIEDGAFVDKTMGIPLGNRINQLFTNLMDGAGSQVIHKRVRLNVSSEVLELFIDIFSDAPEKLRYINGVGVGYSMLRTRTLVMDEENFPEDEIGLNLVNVLLVSDYGIWDLSEMQSQTLVEQVRSGGIMILGAGARVDDTLGRFAPEFLDESYDAPELVQVNVAQDFEAEGPGNAVLEMVCVDFSLSGANVIFSDDQLALLATVVYGKGTTVVAAYDFADIAEFCQRNPPYIDALFTNVPGEDKINRLAELAYSGNSNQYWPANNMINTGNVDRLPDIPLYTMEIIIYIFLVGPGVCIFLRQRELNRYYRSTVALLSLTSAAIIYLVGSRTRLQDTFYTYTRFLDISEDMVNETTYLNIQTSHNNPHTMKLDPGYSIKPITGSYYDNMSSIPKFTGSEDYKVVIRHEADATTVSAQNVIAFEPKYLQLNKTEADVKGIGSTGAIVVFEDEVTGSVTNSFKEPVKNAALLLYDKMILLGDMEPGETKKLDDLELLQVPLAHSNQIVEKIMDKDQYEEPDINSRDYMDTLTRTNLLVCYLDNSVASYTTNARVVGIINQSENDPLHLDTYEVEGITMVSSSTPVYQDEDGVTYRSVLMRKPTVISGSYCNMSNTLYGTDLLTIEYSLGSDIEVEKLYTRYVSESFMEMVSAGSLTPFTGSICFYNHNTGNYDKMNGRQLMYTREQLDDHLSPGNTVMVKYLYSSVSEYSWDILPPMLDIVGREY